MAPSQPIPASELALSEPIPASELSQSLDPNDSSTGSKTADQRTHNAAQQVFVVRQNHQPAGRCVRVYKFLQDKVSGYQDREKFEKIYADYQKTMRDAAESMNKKGSITLKTYEKHTIATIKVAENHYYALKISNKKDVKTKIKEAFYPIIAAHALIENDCHQGKLCGMSFHFVLNNKELQIEPQDPNKTKEFKERFKNEYGLDPQFTFNDSKPEPEVKPKGLFKFLRGKENRDPSIDVKKATRCNASFDKILRDFSKLNREAWKKAATFFIHPKHKNASENKLELSQAEQAVDRAFEKGSAKFTQPERSAITKLSQANLNPAAMDSDTDTD